MNKKVFADNLLRLVFAASLLAGAAIMLVINLVDFINGVQLQEPRLVASEIVGSIFPICIAACAGFLAVKTVLEVSKKKESDDRLIFLYLIVSGALSFVDAFISMAIAGTWQLAFNWFEVFASLAVCSLAVFPAFVVKGENRNVFGFFSCLAATVYYITYFSFAHTGVMDRTSMAMYSFLGLAFLLASANFGCKILFAQPKEEVKEPSEGEASVEPEPEEEKKDELHPDDYAE